MNANRKRLSVALGTLFVLGAIGAATHHFGIEASPVASAQADGNTPPAADVDVATVVAQQITEWQSYSGRLEAIDKVDIRPLVPGKIVAVHFKDGQLVKKGESLFTIDPRPYQAEVDRAAAQLAAAEARAAYASSDAARADRLIGSNAIAKRDYDEKQNASREASASVKAARAALDAARVNLSYTDVAAPVAGRVSRAELTVGNIVSTGASAPLLTTVVSVSPMYASFEVDEQTYLRYLRSTGKKEVPVELGLADEAGYLRTGAIVSVDNRLDVTSGTIRVRARFDNADGALVPGLFARVKVGGGQARDAVMIYDASVSTDQAKKYVLVVGKDNRVQYREVKIGNLHDGLRIVENGLQAGDQIVVSGMQRVRPNDAVKPHPVNMVDAARVSKPAA
ncbi:efflux RND transporter periplasmic adaptor subunit [Cupriavidus pauculus]|uniref:efflux RND transporter periplasmic adaptor subunit n=1 Tax=Cupriavidus pauculus TaxID=82633 RepID=UPI001EE1CBED|nr:efflux RND transporter periplasmic adaptor subunit [Cupriavidus pauculus]GJG93104.1 efflux RND transporter periplasmic adaptor subunit [Cupriavidus pauculus]